MDTGMMVGIHTIPVNTGPMVLRYLFRLQFLTHHLVYLAECPRTTCTGVNYNTLE